MSHDVTVRSHPRHTGWGFLPLLRSDPAQSRYLLDLVARVTIISIHTQEVVAPPAAASQTARSSISSSSLPLVSGTRKKTKRRDSSAKTA